MAVPPLLATKLYPPPCRYNLVPRPRLTEKLTAGVRSGQRFTLVCAPAGFGKTTLVVEWLSAAARPDGPGTGRRFCWVSLDEADNDLGVFLRYLLAALQTLWKETGRETANMLSGGRLPPAEMLLLPLLNDLLAVPEPFVLALDDYHAIHDPVIHEAMAFLLEHQPPAMHTILTTRQDPLLPLARWRARGELQDIRLAELRFTPAEAAEFMNRMTGLRLSEEDVNTLEAHTEGWIAGLQMAAISLQQTGCECGGSSASEFIRAFTGDDRFIMDYLVDEVLCCQKPEMQDFLLQTSVLERFNAPLCEAILENPPAGEASAAERLAYLERANLFLIPLDNRRQWFRYHHLFSELLRYRLKTTHGPEAAARLQRRAALWCAENGFADQAILYAQAAADWDLCAGLVARNAARLIRVGELTTLLRWIRALPESVVRSNPFLCRSYGYALTNCGQLLEGEKFLALAQQGFADDPDALGTTLAFTSHNALFRGDFNEEIALARRSLDLLKPDNTWMRAVSALSLGLGLLHNGDIQAAEPAFKDACRFGTQAESFRTVINALAYLGRICVLRLDFTQAEAHFRRGAAYRLEDTPHPGCDLALFDLAMLKYEQNELDEALELTHLGLEVNRRSGSIEMLAYGYRLLARLFQLRGEAPAAAEYLQKALKLAAGYDLSPLTLSLNAALQVEMALTDGDLPLAELAAPRVTNSLGLYTFLFYPETARAHLLIIQGRNAEALRLLEPVLERAAQPGWEYARLQVRVLQALAAAEPGRARLHLAEALALARTGGARRTFLDLGAPMQALLRESAPRLDDPASRAYALGLLPAFPENPLEPAAPAAAELVEQLSEREVEVLRMVAGGMSNAEIAQKLYLSPNTLKAHTQNIYSKLDVHSRVQAVNRARELGII